VWAILAMSFTVLKTASLNVLSQRRHCPAQSLSGEVVARPWLYCVGAQRGAEKAGKDRFCHRRGCAGLCRLALSLIGDPWYAASVRAHCDWASLEYTVERMAPVFPMESSSARRLMAGSISQWLYGCARQAQHSASTWASSTPLRSGD
jgi:hypothetical protein